MAQNRQKLTTFVDEVDPDYFNSSNCKNIFKMIKMYFEKYSSMPSKPVIISSIQKLMGSQEKGSNINADIFKTIDEVFDRKEFTNDELQYFHDELLKFIKTGKIRDVMLKGISKIDDPTAFDEIQEELKVAVLWKIDENLGIDITDVTERYLKHRDILGSFIETPWRSLSEIIGGGFYPKTISSFVAGSSVGKSIALDQVAFFSWAQLNKNVLMISLELSEEMKGLRMDTHHTKIQMHELINRESDVLAAYSKINSGGKRLIIKEFPTSSINSRKISQYVNRLQMYSGFKPDIILVDYADILLPNSNKKDSMYTAGGEVFEQLRGIAYEFEVPVVTATQFNRNYNDKPPEEVTEFDISESSKKMMTSDNMIAIVATPGMRSQKQAAFKTLKARIGQKDIIIPLTVSYENFTFEES
jgi:replicative DNA helicase